MKQGRTAEEPGHKNSAGSWKKNMTACRRRVPGGNTHHGAHGADL